MRITVLILLTALMQVSAISVAQKVNFVKKNASLEQVFNEITKQTGYNILLPGDKLNIAETTDANFKNATLNTVLNQTLSNLDFTFIIEDKTIIIKPKEPSFLEKVVGVFQDINISGRVVDADGRGLPGASVSVKGKGGKAVSTGANGSFYLKGVNEDAVLVISFIGYVPKEIRAAKELGDIVIKLSTSKLDEVQVIAYGTTTQRLSTGNVTTIKADVIEKQPVNNPLLALQGRVPGLFIEQATGFAGTGVKVRIQGQNSLNNGSDPLYVVDGVPFSSQLLPGGNPILGQSGGSGGLFFGNPMNFINPADIESIDILKDADATAIYGSRAANGAILITTKKGKSGNTRVDVNLQSGWAKVSNKLDLMDAEQYLEMRREAMKNDGIAAPNMGPYGDNDLNGNWDNTRNSDWQKELIGGRATYQDLNTSFTAGNDRTTFLLGTSYHRETAVFPGDYSDKKASLHFSINNTSINQRFKMQFSGSYLFDNNQLPNIDMTESAMFLPPVAPALYKSDGSINWGSDAKGASTFSINPIGYTFNKSVSKAENLTGNMILSYQVLPGLDLKSSFGYNSLTLNGTSKEVPQSYYPEIQKYISRSTTFSNSSINSWTIEPQLTYLRSLGKGRLEVLLGATVLQNNSTGSSTFTSGYSNDLVMDDILSATSIRALSSTDAIYKYDAIFGRINYNWQDKYILNFTARRDGSSRFGPKSQFHNFGAIGAAWVFSNEHIVKDHLSFLSFGKLRGSYGTTGSDQIGNYKTLSLYDPLPQDRPYQGLTVYQPNGIANPYLEWEQTTKIQAGIDLGFLKDRLLLNVNYYTNHSSNQLSGYQLPITTGFTEITRNQTYKIRNYGWEFLLASTNFHARTFSWSSNINLTIPKTLVVDYPDILKSSDLNSVIIGQPLSAMSVYHFLGVDPATGIYLFADKNGNPTTVPDDFNSESVVLDLAPRFYGGFQNTFTYRNFSLDVLFSFVKQIAQNFQFSGYVGPGEFNGGTGNQLSSLLDRWQQPGDIANIQKFSANGSLAQSLLYINKSDAAWSDASYIRVKNISLSWALPDALKKRMHLQRFDLFAQGQNLLTITHYKGLDPETKSSRSLPTLRVLTLGVKIGL